MAGLVCVYVCDVMGGGLTLLSEVENEYLVYIVYILNLRRLGPSK